MYGADVAERLDREADDVRGQAAHAQEQGDQELAARYLQIELGLRLVAHVFGAVHGDDEVEVEAAE